MANTNIEAIRAILSAGVNRMRDHRGQDGYAYAAGYLESTLADALDELAKHDLNAAERILHRLKSVK